MRQRDLVTPDFTVKYGVSHIAVLIVGHAGYPAGAVGKNQSQVDRRRRLQLDFQQLFRHIRKLSVITALRQSQSLADGFVKFPTLVPLLVFAEQRQIGTNKS